MLPIRTGQSERLAARGLAAALMLVAALMLGACRSSEVSSSDFVDDVEPPGVLYNQALASMEAGNLGRALKRLETLDRQHPYSEYSRKALILQTFITYRQGQYPDAAALGERYVALYPGDEDAAYAQYLVGMSHFRQMPDVTRDQTETGKAFNAFQKVVEQYPDSEYVTDSRNKMLVVRDQLAGKEMFNGRYYLERREYLAAINRFRYVVENFETTRHVEEALARLTEAYFALGLAGEAETAAAVLGHNFPDSAWYADSVTLLRTGGLEPRENPKSWLAGIGRKLSRRT